MTRLRGAERQASPSRGRIAMAAALVAVIVVCVVGVYGLWEREPEESSVTPPRQAEQTTNGPVSMDGRAPLTGVLTDEAMDHPAVTVKVSNTPDAHPHRGVGVADIVFVEPITGGTTRLAAIFHSRLPAEVGPVRSLRPMDAPLIAPTRGVIANTMAAPWVLKYVDEVADLSSLGTLRVPRGTYRIDDSRPAPNHVFTRPDALLALTDRTKPPRPYFNYAASVERSTAQRDGRRATSVTAGYGGSATATWTYDRASGRWLRAEAWSAHVLENGRRVSAVNVIVLRANRDTTFTQATASMTIPDFIHTSGSLLLFTGDKAVSGRWTKGGVNQPFRFTTAEGEALLLGSGTTWVECVLPSMPVRTSRNARG